MTLRDVFKNIETRKTTHVSILYSTNQSADETTNFSFVDKASHRAEGWVSVEDHGYLELIFEYENNRYSKVWLILDKEVTVKGNMVTLDGEVDPKFLYFFQNVPLSVE